MITNARSASDADDNRITLGRLWQRYRCECETLRDTDPTHQSNTATRAAILLAYFGEEYDVERLNKDAQRRYERARAAGGLRYRHERRVVRFGRVHTETVVHVSQPTRARSAEADLVLLHAMLNSATTVRGPNGTRWLTANPLKGVERRPEKKPQRPVTCQERFDATRRAIQARIARAKDGSTEQLRWIRLELALVLAEATGRRIGAIRQLRWEDIDYAVRRSHGVRVRTRWACSGRPICQRRWSPNYGVSGASVRCRRLGVSEHEIPR